MPTIAPPQPQRIDRLKGHADKAKAHGRQQAEAPLNLNDLKQFESLTEDEQYSLTVQTWRKLCIKLGTEGLRTALSGSKLDRNKLAGILTAAGISHDKAWSKRENTAVLLAIPASIQAVIASSLGLVTKSVLPKVIASSPAPLPQDE